MLGMLSLLGGRGRFRYGKYSYLRLAVLGGDFEEHHACARAMVSIHQDDCDPINDMGSVDRQRDNPLCRQTHVLLQQGCSHWAAVDDATAEGAVQSCVGTWI